MLVIRCVLLYLSVWHCVHLSGHHVVPDEDEVDALVSSDAQSTLDAPQVRRNVWQSGRLCPAMATGETETANQKKRPDRSPANPKNRREMTSANHKHQQRHRHSHSELFRPGASRVL